VNHLNIGNIDIGIRSHFITPLTITFSPHTTTTTTTTAVSQHPSTGLTLLGLSRTQAKQLT
jgi:hypothetical protein